MANTDINQKAPPPLMIPSPVIPAKRKLDVPLTPIVRRYNTYRAFTFASLEDRRKAIMHGMPETITEIPVRKFMDHLLPKIRLDAKQLATLYLKLKSDGIYNTNIEDWSLLGTSKIEANDFKDMGKLESKIVELAAEISKEVIGVEFTSNGDLIPEAEWKKYDMSRPDGGCQRKGGKGGVWNWHWGKIFRADEYKCSVGGGNKYDNLEKTFWSLHFILCHDISRRFAFGLTIADRTARLYFCCRSFLAVSEEFDISKDWKTFVELTVMFGLGSDEELGWDQTIDRKSNGEVTISVGATQYTIVEVLSDFRAFSILGRATRIFKAKIGGPDEEVEVVIKDVWVDATRRREHEIQNSVVQDLVANRRGESVVQHLFTHLNFGDVHTSDGRVDSTATMTENSKGEELKFSSFKKMSIVHPHGRITPLNTSGNIPGPNASTPMADDGRRISGHLLPTNVVPRVHYRLVMEEVAECIHDVYDLGKCVKVLSELNDVIFALAKANWVHRDLSTTNVYYYERPKEGGNGELAHLKLGDLEYAKNIEIHDEGTSHDVRTGTHWFWSTEIESGSYLWKPPSPGLGDTTHRLTHNPLHECESLWWILLYLFGMRMVVGEGEGKVEGEGKGEGEVEGEVKGKGEVEVEGKGKGKGGNWDEKEQKRLLGDAFPDTVNSTLRRDIFGLADKMGGLLETFHEGLEPFKQPCAEMRYLIQTTFMEAEKGNSPEPATSVWEWQGNFHDKMRRKLGKLCQVRWPEMQQFSSKDQKK